MFESTFEECLFDVEMLKAHSNEKTALVPDLGSKYEETFVFDNINYCSTLIFWFL